MKKSIIAVIVTASIASSFAVNAADFAPVAKLYENAYGDHLTGSGDEHYMTDYDHQDSSGNYKEVSSKYETQEFGKLAWKLAAEVNKGLVDGLAPNTVVQGTFHDEKEAVATYNAMFKEVNKDALAALQGKLDNLNNGGSVTLDEINQEAKRIDEGYDASNRTIAYKYPGAAAYTVADAGYDHGNGVTGSPHFFTVDSFKSYMAMMNPQKPVTQTALVAAVIEPPKPIVQTPPKPVSAVPVEPTHMIPTPKQQITVVDTANPKTLTAEPIPPSVQAPVQKVHKTEVVSATPLTASTPAKAAASAPVYDTKRDDRQEAAIYYNAQAIDQNSSAIAAEGRARSNGDRAVAAESRAYTNQKFSQLKSEVDSNRKEANAGTSAALGAAAIPQVTDSQKFAIGAGTGTYNGEGAVAVGFSTHLTSSIVTKAFVTGDTQQNFGAGAGVSIGW